MSGGQTKARGGPRQRERGVTPRRDPRRRLIDVLALGVGCALFAAGTAAVALYTVPPLQLAHRVTVMAAAFIPFGLPAFAGAAVLFAAWRRRWAQPLALAAVAGLVLQFAWARPYLPAPAPEPAPAQVTVLSMNLRCYPVGLTQLATLTAEVHPDVAVVQGLTLKQRSALGSTWGQLLPYATFHPMAHLPECGTFVFSRTPLRPLSGPTDPQPVVEVARPDGPLVLLPVDLPTPTNGVTPWLEGFGHLDAAAQAHRTGRLIAVGDFNAVREHVPLRRLLRATGLRDASELAGAGWTPTFPSGRRLRPPVIALDHALLGPGLTASRVRTANIPGQEHRALIVAVQPDRTP